MTAALEHGRALLDLPGARIAVDLGEHLDAEPRAGGRGDEAGHQRGVREAAIGHQQGTIHVQVDAQGRQPGAATPLEDAARRQQIDRRGLFVRHGNLLRCCIAQSMRARSQSRNAPSAGASAVASGATSQ